MSGEPVRILDDAENADAVEARLNNEANEVWKGRVNIDNFVAIFTHHPGAFHVTVTMGLKNPNAQNPDSPNTVLGHVFNVDPLYAESLMSTPVEELYQRFMEKSSTRNISKTDKDEIRRCINLITKDQICVQGILRKKLEPGKKPPDQDWAMH